jgi:hypothetical protein
MTDFTRFIEKTWEKSDDLVSHLPKTSADKLGLDIRAGYKLWIDMDDENFCIIVSKENNRMLSYYGGFEYIDKSHIVTIGDCIVYMMNRADGETCDRIESCYYAYTGKEEPEPEE